LGVLDLWHDVMSCASDADCLYLQTRKRPSSQYATQNRKIYKYRFDTDVLSTILDLTVDAYDTTYYYPVVIDNVLYAFSNFDLHGAKFYYYAGNQFNLVEDFELRHWLYQLTGQPLFYLNNNYKINQDENSYFLGKFQLYQNSIVMQGVYDGVLSLVFFNPNTNEIDKSYPIPSEISFINILKVYNGKLLLGTNEKGLWVLRDTTENISFERVL
jgi:hypothetical protein